MSRTTTATIPVRSNGRTVRRVSPAQAIKLVQQGVAEPVTDSSGELVEVQRVRGRRKYHNEPTVVDGVTFDSRQEAEDYRILKAREHAGEITDLQIQPSFELIPAFTDTDGKRHRAMKYVADFSFREIGNISRLVVWDSKGIETPVFKLKAKLFRYVYPEVDFRVQFKERSSSWKQRRPGRGRR